MKQTFYVQEYSDGSLLLTKLEVCGSRRLLGTITLDVEPIRKEVEKVIHKPYLMCLPEGKQITNYLPMNSYDIKVTYKIKE
jgi:hypothetical protein